ncbi:MAG: hypothetical protein K9M75_00400 [Phycisphaerae bacterium]|nr:hypothetical protein [Phycisphaerae bacterium]
MGSLKKKVAGVGAGVLAAAGIVYLKGGGGGLKEFETFESAEGRFSVSMPGKPEKITQTVKSQIGDIVFTMFAADSKELGFIVGYSDYPADFVETSDPIENLGWIIYGVVADVKGKLVQETILEINGKAAKEYQVDIPEKGTLISRLILDDRRLYQLIAMFPTGGQDEKRVSEFLDSFKVNN